MEKIITHCPYCGRPAVYRSVFGQERPTCLSCEWIHFVDPKVAAAAVVRDQGRVLLTRRVNPPFQGAWTLPAGFVDGHEDPARAAERECLEEAGLEVEVTGLVDVIAGREHPRGADIFIVYTARCVGGTLQAGDDADEAAFFALDDLPPLAFETTTKILARLKSITD